MARAGQLMLNKGKWLDKNDKAVQLISEKMVVNISEPSFPNVDSSYGLLTWLNRPSNPSNCCSPTWGNDKCKNGQHYFLNSTLLKDEHRNVSIAIGFLGK